MQSEYLDGRDAGARDDHRRRLATIRKKTMWWCRGGDAKGGSFCPLFFFLKISVTSPLHSKSQSRQPIAVMLGNVFASKIYRWW
jgi:hypothetical protein